MELESFLCSTLRSVNPQFPSQGQQTDKAWTTKMKKSLNQLESSITTPIGSGRSLERIQPLEMKMKSSSVVGAIGILEQGQSASAAAAAAAAAASSSSHPIGAP